MRQIPLEKGYFKVYYQSLYSKKTITDLPHGFPLIRRKGIHNSRHSTIQLSNSYPTHFQTKISLTKEIGPKYYSQNYLKMETKWLSKNNYKGNCGRETDVLTTD